MNQDYLGIKRELSVNGRTYSYYSLAAMQEGDRMTTAGTSTNHEELRGFTGAYPLLNGGPGWSIAPTDRNPRHLGWPRPTAPQT